MKIVILGTGFCGATLAKKLENKFEVTVINPKPFFEYTPSLHKTVLEKKYKNKITIPLKSFLRKTSIEQGTVKEITQEYVKTSQKIFYDKLVVCTGSEYPVKIKNQENVLTLDKLENALKINKKLEETESVLIVGGGLIGTELAAELATKTSKKITLVHSKERLIERNPLKASEYAKKFLEKKNVRVVLGEKVVKHEQEYVTNKKNKIKAGLCVWSAGINWNPPKMKGFEKALNDKKQLVVDEFLRLKNYPNVYVGGDANNVKEEKTAQNAEQHADLIARNLEYNALSKPLEPYKKKQGPLVISLGDSKGIIVYKNHVLTGFIPGITKHLVQEYTLSRMNGLLSKVLK